MWVRWCELGVGYDWLIWRRGQQRPAGRVVESLGHPFDTLPWRTQRRLACIHSFTHPADKIFALATPPHIETSPSSIPERCEFIEIKFHLADKNREIIEPLSAALTSHHLETVRVWHDVEKCVAITLPPQELMKEAIEIIRSCQPVVIEKGAGPGIEFRLSLRAQHLSNHHCARWL